MLRTPTSSLLDSIQSFELEGGLHHASQLEVARGPVRVCMLFPHREVIIVAGSAGLISGVAMLVVCSLVL